MSKKSLHKEISVKVLDIIKLNRDSCAIRLERPKDFDYKPGQFIMLYLDLKESPTFSIDKDVPKRQKRAYSMSSSPTNKAFIETTVKIAKDGFVSKYLVNELKKGDTVQITGPLGMFFYDENLSKNLVLLGGGSGITPLLGILRYVFDNRLKTRVVLIYSNRTEEDILWKDELESLAKYPYVTIVNTLTRCDWSGECGRINEEKIRRYAKDFRRATYFVCGQPEFVEHCCKVVEDMGVPKEKIKREKYS